MKTDPFEGVPKTRRHLLRPEAGICFEYPEGQCRIVLAIGLQADSETGAVSYHGLALREEVVAMLWTSLLTRNKLEPQAASRLYKLPCHWVPPDVADLPAESDVDADVDSSLSTLLAQLDHLWLLKPVRVAAFDMGDNPDDAIGFAFFVGEDENTGELTGFGLQEAWVERLWQILLMGPGAVFGEPSGPLGEIIHDEANG